MARSNDEIYDLLHEIDKKLAVLTENTNLRLKPLEEGRARSWQVRLSLYSALFTVPMASAAIWVSIVKG